MCTQEVPPTSTAAQYMIGNLTSSWSSCRELMVPHGRAPAIARTEIDHAMVENDPIKHSIWTRVST